MATKNKLECEICNVSTSDQISYENHLLGSKHQLALHMKRVREKKEKCSIFIRGFPRLTERDTLYKFFSKHGKITDFFPDVIERFAIIQFEEEKTVEKLLKMPLYFQGRKLSINRRILKNSPETKNQQNPQDEKEVINEKILQRIDSKLNFNQQLDQLIGAVQLPFQSTMNIYNQLCADIQDCLNTKFVNCRVWPFGSTVSGLGFKHSDIDVFIEVLCHPEVVVPRVGAVPGVATVPDEEECNLAAEYVKIARKCLNKSRLFNQVIAVPKAKTPIVKCVHKPIGVSCDMNFKNMLGVCNSRLINFMLNLDARLRPTMIIIKFWAQQQEISGSGRISNYGLTMMFLFYLQQLSEPIVPPIGLLQTEHTVQFHEGWNGGFCSDLAFLPNIKTANKSTIPELLHGFFQFYDKYDYGFNVICPLIGQSVPKAEFMTPENLPEKLFHYKNMLKSNHCKALKCTLPLCVQDPFELSHNITAMVQQRLLEHFRNSCHITSSICAKCLTGNESNNDLLLGIFKKQHILNSIGVSVSDEECVFRMQVNPTLNYIDQSSIKETFQDKSKALREAWFEKVNQFLISALSKIFLFKMTIKKEIQKHKYQKVEELSDVHNSNSTSTTSTSSNSNININSNSNDNVIIDSISFHCVGYHNVWDARKSIAKNFNQVENSSPNFLEQEIAISDYIANELCKGIEISEPIVDFHLEFRSRINPTEAEFYLKNEKSRKHCFRHLANYLRHKLAPWFEKWLKEGTDKEKDGKGNKSECEINKTQTESESKSESEPKNMGTWRSTKIS